MIYLNLDSLDTGGYCFGDKIYVRDNLRQIVNKDLYVTYASKIGLDVGTSAIVIFYKGRNITSSLIEELIEKGIVKKTDNNELVFLQERKEEVPVLFQLQDLLFAASPKRHRKIPFQKASDPLRSSGETGELIF